MTFVQTQPEMMSVAAEKFSTICTGMQASNRAAAQPTTGVIPAAADHVSILTAAHFAAYGQLYQHISSQADAILELFVTTLQDSAGAYSLTEDTNAALAN